eukprot:4190812-Amphidinium_carterae.1
MSVLAESCFGLSSGLYLWPGKEGAATPSHPSAFVLASSWPLHPRAVELVHSLSFATSRRASICSASQLDLCVVPMGIPASNTALKRPA